MDITHLIPMANRIAQFFSAQPREDEQLTGVSEHIRLFWSPDMRASLKQYVKALPEENGQTELDPLVVKAVRNAYDAL